MNRQYDTVTDFIMDECFCQWVIQTDAKSDEFWTNWLAQYPCKRRKVEEARDLILLLRTTSYLSTIPQSKIDVSLQHIMIKIRHSVDRLKQSGQNDEVIGND